MNTRLAEIFKDKELVEKIQRKLPLLFHLAELEASRAGRVGMEVGSIREQILIALLVYKFGNTRLTRTWDKNQVAAPIDSTNRAVSTMGALLEGGWMWKLGNPEIG